MRKKGNMAERQYYIVGASYGGYESQLERFIEDGIWALGWSGDDASAQHASLIKMNRGDFIAIKRMNGRGASDVTILARGIVCGVITEAKEEKRFVCTVNWIETNLQKIVPARHQGIFQSVAGPFSFTNDQDWLIDVFGF